MPECQFHVQHAHTYQLQHATRYNLYKEAKVWKIFETKLCRNKQRALYATYFSYSINSYKIKLLNQVRKTFDTHL